jgi:hypothetical protein
MAELIQLFTLWGPAWGPVCREVLAEEAADLLALHRPAEVVALADVAAHAAQGQELGRVLDPSATVTTAA